MSEHIVNVVRANIIALDLGNIDDSFIIYVDGVPIMIRDLTEEPDVFTVTHTCHNISGSISSAIYIFTSKKLDYSMPHKCYSKYVLIRSSNIYDGIWYTSALTGTFVELLAYINERYDESLINNMSVISVLANLFYEYSNTANKDPDSLPYLLDKRINAKAAR